MDSAVTPGKPGLYEVRVLRALGGSARAGETMGPWAEVKERGAGVRTAAFLVGLGQGSVGHR